MKITDFALADETEIGEWPLRCDAPTNGKAADAVKNERRDRPWQEFD